jgi:Poly(hydroxyalcanoate) granule associated protein (phasin)
LKESRDASRHLQREKRSMSNTVQLKTGRVGDTVYAASRQVWLAGLGAAVVTRDWAEKEAGTVFRTLVREGSAVESRAIRFVGDRVESSVTRANAVWRKTRATVETMARTYADTAVSIVRQALPKSLPKVELPAMLKPASPAKAKRARARKPVKTRARRRAKVTKR